MAPFDCFKTYLALKNHFTKTEYDYHKYCGKSRANLQTFYKRKDRFWFEKVSRNRNDTEIVDFFVSNFISCTDPQTLWIGEIIKQGEGTYTEWKKRIQSLSYVFKEEVGSLFLDKDFNRVFEIKGNSHPILLKEHLSNNVSIETMVILDKILGYKNNFDKKMDDPIWEIVSLKIKKYSPFLNIDIFMYKKILKEVVL
jgi:hypothetical protein